MEGGLEECPALMFLGTFFAPFLSFLFIFFTALLFAPDLKRIGMEK